MKTTRFFLFFFCLSLVSPLFARAEGPASIQKIGLVDLGKVFREYEGTKASESELEKLSTAKQQEREKKVGEIRDMRDELALLNDDTRDQKRQTIEEHLRQLAGFDQEARESLRGKRDEVLDKILAEIEKVVTAYAKEKGYELVLSDRAVLYGVDAMDITNEVIKILNQNYSKR